MFTRTVPFVVLWLVAVVLAGPKGPALQALAGPEGSALQAPAGPKGSAVQAPTSVGRAGPFGPASYQAPARSSGPAAADASADAAFVKQYCITCHNERMKANFGNLALDTL